MFLEQRAGGWAQATSGAEVEAEAAALRIYLQAFGGAGPRVLCLLPWTGCLYVESAVVA